jgi:hypothetical protein
MSAIVSCPACRRALQVPEDFFGRTVQCPDCKQTFEAKPPEAAVQVTASPPAPAPSASPSAAPSTASPAWEEPPPVEKKRRRRERDDEDDDDDLDDLVGIGRRRRGRPDRGGVILTLGIISLVTAFLSLSLYFLPIWIVPLTLGITGWVLGHRDLRAMREGTMDSQNQAMTLVAMILSIVGFSFSVLAMLFSCALWGFLGVACGAGAFK